MKRSRAAYFDTAQLEQALASNRELQVTLSTELERLRQHQAANRQQAALLVAQLLAQYNQTVSAIVPDACSEKNTETTRTIEHKRLNWSRRFFVDHKRTQPNPNPDTIRRRLYEKHHQDSFFYHFRPPWTPKECQLLKQVVQEQQHSSDHDTSSSIDFDLIAATLQLKQQEMQNTSSKKSLKLPRTADECRIHYQDICRPAITPVETKALCTLINSNNTGEVVDWQEIAKAVSTLEISRTAFDCLRAYQSTIATKSTPWTLIEDEVMLKLIAAAGPQAVIESKNPLVQQTIFTQLITNKSKHKVFVRLNGTLLNPKIKHNRWSDDEERRLPILLKIYNHHDATPDDSNALRMASTHYNRNVKSVVDKWQRTLNPQYSTQPFTRDEDERMKDILRANVTLSWTELSRQYFPHRHPQRLTYRWTETASDKEILERERALLEANNSKLNEG